MLVDNVEIKVVAGKGGGGLATFKREKFLPFGGPDGGDGGRGGNIYLKIDIDMIDLSTFKHKTVFKAEHGGIGGKNKMHGLNAPDLVIRVPAGTTAYVKKDGEIVQKAEFTLKGQSIIVARGGKGGKGNVHFATATRKAPHFSQPGEEGERCEIELQMSLLVDVCIIGYPNAGKSTLLAAISGARPKIAEYLFTTQEPVLGNVDDGEWRYTWAEIPAIVKGSNEGKGIGNSFLKHLARASVVVYLLDASAPQIMADLACLQNEVEKYNVEFAGKRYVVALNKIDMLQDQREIEEISRKLAADGVAVFAISGEKKTGIQELVASVHKLVAEGKTSLLEEPEPEVIFRPRPVDRQD